MARDPVVLPGSPAQHPPPNSGKLSVLSVPSRKRHGGGQRGEEGFRLSGERVGAVTGQRKPCPRERLVKAVILYGLLMNSIL